MRRFFLALATASTLFCAASPVFTYAGGEKAAALPEGVKAITTEELTKLMAEKPGGVYVFDSRDKAAYEKAHVDGAKSLPLASFDVSQLPSDKSALVVFYCGGPSCTLAPASAKKALEAGYSNLAVYHDGIKGWTSAGKKS